MNVFYAIYALQIFLSVCCTVFYTYTLVKIQHHKEIGIGGIFLMTIYILSYTLIPLLGFILIWVFVTDGINFLDTDGKEIEHGK